jgi:predicted N-acetyltransferase YhbS
MAPVHPPLTDVRKARPADAAIVRGVLDRSYRTLLADSYGPRLAAEIAEYAGDGMEDLLQSDRYFVVIRGTRVVACGGWSDQSPSGIPLPERAVFIRRFAVLPEHERQGLGRSLFDACRMAAEEAAAGIFYVRSTINAEKFYGSLGFGVVERTLIALPHGASFPAVLMKRTR